MSNGYGVDFYGIATYGFSQPASYSVTPFTAIQTDYNRISLVWTSPNVTTWKSLILVRSLYGYPSTPIDGTTVLTVTSNAMRTNFDDLGLLSGRIYYYTMFINIEAPTFAAGTTYSISQVVLYNGLYWRSLSNSNTGNTPAVGSAFWINTQYLPVWYPAGYTASLSVTPNNYTNLLYAKVPQPYKVANSDIFANTVTDNPALLHYLSIFGYFLDMTKTEYDLYLQGNNPDVISATSLDILGQQLGLSTDYLSTPQQRRQRVKNAAVNYRIKGTAQSIHNIIAETTGWDSIVTPGINLLRHTDQAQFSSPILDTWDPATTYFPNQLIQFNGYNYKNLVQANGATQQPTGSNTANTWWTPQVRVLDTTTLKNPTTYNPGTGGYAIGGFSTWGYAEPAILNGLPETFTQVGVYTGLPHPTNATIQNWNALGYQFTGTVPSTINALNMSTASPYTATWSNSTNYVIGNYVSNIGKTFKAIKPSGPGTPFGFVTPGTNENFWLPLFEGFITTASNVQLDPINWQDDSVPVKQFMSWNSSTKYKIGDQVEFFGIIYQAAIANTNTKPTGYYYSSSNWIYLQPAEISYTTSAYSARLSTNTTTNVSQIATSLNVLPPLLVPNSLGSFPPQGGFSIMQQTISSSYGSTLLRGYLSRFEADYADLNGINDNTLSDLGRPWAATPATANLWRSSYGMASVDQTLFGTTTYVYLLVSSGIADCDISVTFATDYTDTTHLGHGIVFRYQDASNFWYATRKTLYLVSGGVETVKATYPRIANGGRMTVVCTGLTILINVLTSTYKSTNVVATGSTTLQGATKHGLIQKYSPSGAV